jgi:hypothetical protein
MIFGAMARSRGGVFSHGAFPLAWLGADGMPAAGWFNFCGFVLPGVLAAVALWPLRATLPSDAPWTARIGAQLVFLSALAFATQGLLPLDLEDPDGIASALHASAWTVWCLAFAAGAMLLAPGLRAMRSRMHLVAICALAGAAVPLLAFVAPLWWPGALVQRVAFVLWLLWVAGLGWVLPFNRV